MYIYYNYMHGYICIYTHIELALYYIEFIELFDCIYIDPQDKPEPDCACSFLVVLQLYN